MKVDTTKLKRGSSELTLECRELIDQISKCRYRTDMLNFLKRIEVWVYGKCELYHWIEILDRFDKILEEAARHVNGNEFVLHCDTTFSPEDIQLLLLVLNFTTLLIEHSFSRHLYNSIEHLTQLLSSHNMDIVLAVLNLLYMFSKRSNFIPRLAFDKKELLLIKLLNIAERWGDPNYGLALIDCCLRKPKFEFLYQLFIEYLDENGHIALLEIPDMMDICNSAPLPYVVKIICNQLSNPTDAVKMRIAHRVRLVSGFKDYKLRLQFVQARLQAVSVLIYSNALQENIDKILYTGFGEELCELIDKEDMDLVDIRAAVLRTLTSMLHFDRNPNIPRPGSRLPKIIQYTGAERQGGTLPLLVRDCIASLAGDKPQKKYPLVLATSLFSLLYHLASYEAGGHALVKSGMMQSLLQVISWPGVDLEHITFVTRAVRVIDLITNIDIAKFHQHNGLNVFIDRLEKEINSCRKAISDYADNENRERETTSRETNPDDMEIRVDQDCNTFENDDSDRLETLYTAATDTVSETITFESGRHDADMHLEREEEDETSTSEDTDSRYPSNSYYARPLSERTADSGSSLATNNYGIKKNACVTQRAALLKSMLNFLKKSIQDHAHFNGMRNIMETSLPSSLRHIISNAEYYGPSLFLLATDVVTVYVFNEPSLLSSLQDLGITNVMLQSLLQKDVPATREVLGSLPNVFSALCLNERGLMEFMSYEPFDKLLRVLLSPDYLIAMRRRRSSDPLGDTATNLGNAMDDLMKHHPYLHTDATEAIVRLLNELVRLGTDHNFICWRANKDNSNTNTGTNTNNSNSGGGVGGTHAHSNAIESATNAIQNLENDNDNNSGDDDDDDDEISSASTQQQQQRQQRTPTTSQQQLLVRSNMQEREAIPLIDYILNVMKFIEAIFSNSSNGEHCREFVLHGGLKPLLQLLSLPNLPVDSPVSTTAQAVANVCKSILNLAHETKVIEIALQQLSRIVDKLKPLLKQFNYPGGSVLLSELLNCPKIEDGFSIADYTPLLHSMSSVHGYVVMLVHICRNASNEMRSILLKRWGAKTNTGLYLLQNLVQLYISLVWESTVLLSLCSEEPYAQTTEFNFDESTPYSPVGKEETADGSSGSGNGGGAQSTRKPNRLPANRAKLKPEEQLRYIKSLLAASSRLGRALAELFGTLVKLSVGTPQSRRGRNNDYISLSSSKFPSPDAREIARVLSSILVNGFCHENIMPRPAPKLKLTFLICSVGFTGPMLFDDKRSAFHLMISKFCEENGLKAFFEMFYWALSLDSGTSTSTQAAPVRFTYEHCAAIEHIMEDSEDDERDFPEGTGEFLDAWLQLLEKMVNLRAILDSPYAIASSTTPTLPTSSRSVPNNPPGDISGSGIAGLTGLGVSGGVGGSGGNGSGAVGVVASGSGSGNGMNGSSAQFEPLFYLIQIHQLALHSIRRIWKRKPIANYGVSMTETIMTIMKHLIKSHAILSERYEAKLKELQNANSLRDELKRTARPRVEEGNLNTDHLQMLMDMGFLRPHVMEALQQTRSLEQATEFLLNRPEVSAYYVQAMAETANLTGTQPPAETQGTVGAAETLSAIVDSEMDIDMENKTDGWSANNVSDATMSGSSGTKSMGDIKTQATDIKLIPLNTFNDFCEEALQRIYAFMEFLPETVSTGAELISVLYRRHNQANRHKFVSNLVKNINEWTDLVYRNMKVHTNANKQMKLEELVSVTTADRLFIRFKVSTLLLDEVYADIRKELCLIISQEHCLSALIKLLVRTESVLEEQIAAGKKPCTPRWLQNLIEFIDAIENVSVILQRKVNMRAVCSDNWKWYDASTGRWNSYSEANNVLIRNAFKNGERSLVINIGRQRYTINFTCMTQVSEASGSHRPVLPSLKITDAISALTGGNNSNANGNNSANNNPKVENILTRTITSKNEGGLAQHDELLNLRSLIDFNSDKNDASSSTNANSRSNWTVFPEKDNKPTTETIGTETTDAAPSDDTKTVEGAVKKSKTKGSASSAATTSTNAKSNIKKAQSTSAASLKNVQKIVLHEECLGLWKFEINAIITCLVRMLQPSLQLNFETKLSILKLCARLTKDYENAQIFAQRGGIELLLRMRQSCGLMGFPSYAIIIIRHLLEAPHVLQDAIERVLIARTSQSAPAGHRDLVFVLTQVSSAVARHPKIFINAAKQVLRADYVNSPTFAVNDSRLLVRAHFTNNSSSNNNNSNNLNNAGKANVTPTTATNATAASAAGSNVNVTTTNATATPTTPAAASAAATAAPTKSSDSTSATPTVDTCNMVVRELLLAIVQPCVHYGGVAMTNDEEVAAAAAAAPTATTEGKDAAGSPMHVEPSGSNSSKSSTTAATTAAKKTTENTEPSCCSWHIPSSEHTHLKPIFPRATLLKILSDAVRSYQSFVPQLIVQHMYSPGDSVLIQKEQSCLSFILDHFLPIVRRQQDAEVSMMSRVLICSLADCYGQANVQTKVIQELHQAIVRALLHIDCAEKHIRLQVLIGLLPTLIDSPMLLNKLPWQRNNMYRILLRQGIMTDLSKIAQYKDLSNTNTLTTIYSILRPMELLLRLTVSPGTLTSKRIFFGSAAPGQSGAAGGGGGNTLANRRFYPRLSTRSAASWTADAIDRETVLRDIIRNVLTDRRHALDFIFNADDLFIDAENLPAHSANANAVEEIEDNEIETNQATASGAGGGGGGSGGASGTGNRGRTGLNFDRLWDDLLQSEHLRRIHRNGNSSNTNALSNASEHVHVDQESGNADNGVGGGSDGASTSSEAAAAVVENSTNILGETSTSESDSDSSLSAENDERNEEEDDDDDDEEDDDGNEEGIEDRSETDADEESRQFIEVFDHIYERESSETASNDADVDADDEASEVGGGAERMTLASSSSAGADVTEEASNETAAHMQHEQSSSSAASAATTIAESHIPTTQALPATGVTNEAFVAVGNTQTFITVNASSAVRTTPTSSWVTPRTDGESLGVYRTSIEIHTPNSLSLIGGTEQSDVNAAASTAVLQLNTNQSSGVGGTGVGAGAGNMPRREPTRRLLFLDQQYCAPMPSYSNPTEEGQIELFNQDALHWWLEEAKHLDLESQTDACLYVAHHLLPFLIKDIKIVHNQRKVESTAATAAAAVAAATTANAGSATGTPMLAADNNGGNAATGGISATGATSRRSAIPIFRPGQTSTPTMVITNNMPAPTNTPILNSRNTNINIVDNMGLQTQVFRLPQSLQSLRDSINSNARELCARIEPNQQNTRNEQLNLLENNGDINWPDRLDGEPAATATITTAIIGSPASNVAIDGSGGESVSGVTNAIDEIDDDDDDIYDDDDDDEDDDDDDDEDDDENVSSHELNTTFMVEEDLASRFNINLDSEMQQNNATAIEVAQVTATAEVINTPPVETLTVPGATASEVVIEAALNVDTAETAAATTLSVQSQAAPTTEPTTPTSVAIVAPSAINNANVAGIVAAAAAVDAPPPPPAAAVDELASGETDAAVGGAAAALATTTAAAAAPVMEMSAEVRAALGDLEVPDGVDPSFLAALPSEMREEVIQEHLRMQRIRQRAQQNASQVTHDSLLEVNPEFLAALPPNIQSEVLMQQRIEQQRQAAQSANPEDPVDPAAFFQNLPETLRQAILTDMEESQISSLPPDLAAEAQFLRRDWETRNGPRLEAVPTNALSGYLTARYPSSMHNLSIDDFRWHNNSIWYDAHGMPQSNGTTTGQQQQQQQHQHTTIVHQHPTQIHGKPIALLLMETENNLLDPDSLATLLLFLFIEDAKMNYTRLHRVIRNLCYHVPTREWIINALLSIIEKTNEDKQLHFSTQQAVKPNWIKLRVDAAFGYKSNVFIINKLKDAVDASIDAENCYKNYSISINPQAAQMVVRNCLDLLVILAKHFPRSFLPYNRELAKKTVEDFNAIGRNLDPPTPVTPSFNAATTATPASTTLASSVMATDAGNGDANNTGHDNSNTTEILNDDARTVIDQNYPNARRQSPQRRSSIANNTGNTNDNSKNCYDAKLDDCPSTSKAAAAAAIRNQFNSDRKTLNSNSDLQYNTNSKNFWDVLLSIDLQTPTRLTNVQAFPVASQPSWKWEMKSPDFVSFNDSPFSKLLTMLPYKVICRSPMLTDLLVKLLASLSNELPKEIETETTPPPANTTFKPAEATPTTSSTASTATAATTTNTATAESSGDDNMPEQTQLPQQEQQPQPQQTQLPQQPQQPPPTPSPLTKTPRKMYSKNFYQLQLVVEVLTHQCGSTEGLDNISKLIVNLSNCAQASNAILLQYLTSAIFGLAQEVRKAIQNLYIEILHYNDATAAQRKKQQQQSSATSTSSEAAAAAAVVAASAPTTSAAPAPTPTTTTTGAALASSTSAAASTSNTTTQLLHSIMQDRFTAENVVISAPMNVKPACELQLPAIKKLLSASSPQPYFLRALKIFIQIRELFEMHEAQQTIASGAPGTSGAAAQGQSKLTLSQIICLNKLWNTLSDCLVALKDSKDEYAVLVLQPTVEAFFLIHASKEKNANKNAKDLTAQLGSASSSNSNTNSNADSNTNTNSSSSHLNNANTGGLTEYDPDVVPSEYGLCSVQEAKLQNQLKLDRQNFLSFAEKHRTVLNQILRQSTTHLSDGPFAVLVDHTRVLDFDVKRKYFQTELERIDEGVRREENTVSVRRVTVFEDSFRVLYRLGPEEWKNRFYIVFEDEEGQDAGGLLREWYVIISREIFNPMYALFCVSPGDRVTYMINPSSHANPNHLSYFKFVGRVIAKAIHDNKLLECYFTRSFYKHILGKQVKYTDMESQDYEFYKGLVYLMENDISTLGYELTFSTEVQEFGVTQVRDLIPNGREKAVTEENKFDYVQLVCQLKMSGSIRQQLDAFLEGFYDIIPKHLISIFNEQELELLISGLPDIDIEDLKANTEYHKYTSKSVQIQWFWRALRSFDQADRAKFLQFVTGTSKVPLQGFGSLEGMNGIQKFQIHRDDRSTHRLPCAHTCFNQLDLPMYKSYDKLRSYLLKAIHECSEGFGFA